MILPKGGIKTSLSLRHLVVVLVFVVVVVVIIASVCRPIVRKIYGGSSGTNSRIIKSDVERTVVRCILFLPRVMTYIIGVSRCTPTIRCFRRYFRQLEIRSCFFFVILFLWTK